MHRKDVLPSLGCPFQGLDVPWFPEGGSQILSHDRIFLALRDSGHQKDAGGDAGCAQGYPLGCIGYPQPLGARGFESACALDCAMAVGVGFDHGTDRDFIAYMFLHRAEILCERHERNFGPGSAVQNERAAIGEFAFTLAIITSVSICPGKRKCQPPDRRKFTVISVSTSMGWLFSR